MTLVLLSFAAGVLFLQLQPALPGIGWIWMAPLCLVGAMTSKKLALPAAAAIGLCWALGMAQLKLADRLVPELEGRESGGGGGVAGPPAVGGRSPRLQF